MADASAACVQRSPHHDLSHRHAAPDILAVLRHRSTGEMMHWLNDVRLKWKLFGGFGAMIALLAVVGGIGYQNTTQFATDFTSLYADRLVPVIQLSNAQQGLYELRVAALAYDQADAAGRQTIKS